MGELFNPEIKEIRAKTLTVGQAVALSDAAYDEISKVAGFTHIDTVYNEDDGFYCRIFLQDATGLVVIAWRGSNDPYKDLIKADALEIGLGRTVTQFRNFPEVWRRLTNVGITKSNFADLVVDTGHSLGVALSQGWHVYTRKYHGIENEGIGFATPEVGKSLIKTFSKDDYQLTSDMFSSFKIASIVDPNDIVPKFDNGGYLGRQYMLLYRDGRPTVIVGGGIIDYKNIGTVREHLVNSYSKIIKENYDSVPEIVKEQVPVDVSQTLYIYQPPLVPYNDYKDDRSLIERSFYLGEASKLDVKAYIGD